MTNNWISPVDQARLGNNNDIMTRLATLETYVRQLQTLNVTTPSLDNLALDPGVTNQSFSYVCQGRLSPNTTPVNTADVGSISAINHIPYKGNQVGIYNNSAWLSYIIPSGGATIRTLYNANIGTGLGGTATLGSPVITGISDTSQLIVGMLVTGFFNGGTLKFPIGNTPVTIVSIDSATQITVSTNAAAASGSGGEQYYVQRNTDLDIFGIDGGGGFEALRYTAWNARANGLVSTATNATPIAVTTASPHGLSTGNCVWTENIGGNSNANSATSGPFRITVTGASTFTLQTYAGANVAGSGAPTPNTGWWQQIDSTVTRAQALALQDNIYVLASNPTWRYLGSAHIGTTFAAGLTADGYAQRFIWNYYNRLMRKLRVADASASWTVNTAAGWQADHNDFGNRVEAIVGIVEDIVSVRKYVTMAASPAARAFSGVSIDAVAAPTYFNNTGAAITSDISNAYSDYPSAPGYHYWQGMEEAVGAAATTTGNGQHLIEGEVWG